MSITITNAFTGEPHVDGADVGEFVAGCVGSASYILDIKDKLALTYSGLTATLARGSMIHHGRHIMLDAPESIVLTTTTKKRICTLCLMYSRDSYGVEHVVLTQLVGAETTGIPAAPAIPSGNVLNGDTLDYAPLYDVTVSAGAIVGVSPRINVQKSMAGLSQDVAAVVSSVYPVGIIMWCKHSASPGDMGIPGNWTRLIDLFLVYRNNEGWCVDLNGGVLQNAQNIMLYQRDLSGSLWNLYSREISERLIPWLRTG